MIDFVISGWGLLVGGLWFAAWVWVSCLIVSTACVVVYFGWLVFVGLWVAL